MKFILLFLMISCETRSECDYMFTLPDGTWVCDEVLTIGYVDCEHVLTGRKSERIQIGRDVSVISVKEETK